MKELCIRTSSVRLSKFDGSAFGVADAQKVRDTLAAAGFHCEMDEDGEESPTDAACAALPPAPAVWFTLVPSPVAEVVISIDGVPHRYDPGLTAAELAQALVNDLNGGADGPWRADGAIVIEPPPPRECLFSALYAVEGD